MALIIPQSSRTSPDPTTVQVPSPVQMVAFRINVSVVLDWNSSEVFLE